MHENIYYNKYKTIKLWGYCNNMEKYLFTALNEKETIVSVH